ncbi:S-adenosyl-L-methionine:benzoic acid/salicylic acid carboxyl methyltransferase 1-like [Prosopis cineraria]|uniref:S-adenosyl-L-methionine:benzoic acid/salicylic acid carboxyl methyltransferase 1-like n=1 Tax=Prosopis cineraria TaxID=364024 RepID=UPI0024109778|nr:S-adenosyl-L-methionine:benzoic acid/salicylic acid carboxyl methyltransferase 1-like [Prosopis cineraria]
MDVAQVLHMNEGTSQTSYATNSLIQQKAMSLTKSIKEEAITGVYKTTLASSLAIAELGCSSGPNALFAIQQLIKAVEKLCSKLKRESPEYRIFLNDLPGNDFNGIFKTIDSFKRQLSCEVEGGVGSCFIVGAPGSFYSRIFPAKSLHFVHSSYSLHWLSQVPEGVENNKGNIYISRSSPSNVVKAYYGQFQRDFSSFLKCRAEEVVEGGKMVLTFLGRRSDDPKSKECCYIWDLLAHALNDMVLEGLIKEEQMDGFNLPNYTPSPSEVNLEVVKEGSFTVNHMEVSEVSWKVACGEEDFSDGYGYKVAQCIRAVYEPLVVSHFGEAIVEHVFRQYQEILADRMLKENTVSINVTVSMTKLN